MGIWREELCKIFFGFLVALSALLTAINPSQHLPFYLFPAHHHNSNGPTHLTVSCVIFKVSLHVQFKALWACCWRQVRMPQALLHQICIKHDSYSGWQKKDYLFLLPPITALQNTLPLDFPCSSKVFGFVVVAKLGTNYHSCIMFLE